MVRLALVVSIVGFCLLLLGVRFIVFPELERNRDGLTALLSRQIGQPVEIDMLATGWDGWNPRLDIRGFRILERFTLAPVLTLPEVRLVVAWTSLLVVDLRLKELVIERPQLALRRDAQGLLHVAGIAIDPAVQSDDTRPVDWLLRQRRILIRDALITWRDEQRNAPELLLDHVQFRLESRFGRHRFGLRGVPPAELAAPLDLRGDIVGASLRDWRGFSGRFYARLDYADVAAWREWLPLPVPLKSGKGALRLWCQFAGGDAREIVADLVLADVRAKLEGELPELALDRLDGRVGWRHQGGQREFFTQRLAFTGPKGIRFDPTDFKLVQRDAASGQPPSGTIEFNNLELGPLRQVAAYLPLPERWRSDLASFEPRGTLQQVTLHWEGELTAPDTFTGSGGFIDFGIAAQGKLPGLASLSGSFEATHLGGVVKLQSPGLVLELPRVFAEPLRFDTAQGQIRWRQEKDGIVVGIESLAFANADVAGSASGEYRTLAEGPGAIDLTAQLSRVDAQHVYRYLPLVIHAPARDWVRRGLLAGTSSDTRLKLSGNLADFPFPDARKGQFLVTIKGQGVTLDYADRWPKLTDVDADIRFQGPRITVTGQRGRIFDAALTRVNVEIPDWGVVNPILRIDGEATGPTTDFLRFIAESPVTEWLGRFADGAEAGGSGTLALKLELPLGRPEDDKIAGEYTFAGNRVKLADGVPVLNQVNGKLAFSDRGVEANALTAEILGGPARLTLAGIDGRVRVTGQGTANLSLLRAEYPKEPLATRFSGTTDWKIEANARSAMTTWTIESTLKGVAIDLPVPAAKAAADTAPLKIERRSTDPGSDTIVVTYARLGRLIVHRRLTAAKAIPERALLALGNTEGDADRRGLWIRGNVDALNLAAWLAIKTQTETAADAADRLSLAGVDLHVGAFDVFGRRLSDLQIGASRGGDDWQLDLRGRELAGTARWQAPVDSRPNGRLVARLQRLTAPPSAPDATAEPAAKTELAPAANPWPEIDVIANAFRVKERDLGRLQFVAQPRGSDWHIESLKLANDDGEIDAEGWWRSGGGAQQTNLDVDLDVRDAGKYLARFGLPDAVLGAPTKIHGQLAWLGSPQDFDYPTLTGTLRVAVGPGQFTKIEPGLGKLLGVLNLQSLPRRITLDFRDVFSEGFAFDDITGDVRIQNGVMKSDELKIVGPAARVAISGETDIARETQQLKVRVQPTLSASISVGAAVLMLANPIIGAVVGAGSLLAQKVLRDPIEQMFAYEYAVSGSWSDPVVTRIGNGPAAKSTPSAEANK